MIIGIDGNEANIETRVGIGTFAFNVLWEIYRQIKNKKLEIKNDNSKFKIYLKEKPLRDLPPPADFWSYQVIKPARLWTQITLPLKLLQEKTLGQAPNVFLSLTHYAPRFCPVPTAVCIMDLAYLRFPEMFLPKDLYQLKNWTAYSIRQAKKIITISEFSKKEIVDYYKVDPDKIIVVYPGYDKEKYQKSNIKNKKYPFDKLRTGIEKIKNKYKIDSPYILYVGTIQPRKNLVRLLEAFTILDRKAKPIQDRLKLVICGMMKEGRGGWMQEEIINRIKNLELRIKNDIIITGYIPEEDLPYLITGAKALVLPSLYEGFGIPVVEAMACGVPVVVSNISSLPEIVGDAGILVDPYDTDSIAAGMKEACYNESKREELIKRGIEHVKKFSWEGSGKIVLNTLISFKRPGLLRLNL